MLHEQINRPQTRTKTLEKRRIGRAISDLLKVREDMSGLSAPDRRANENALTALKTAYIALADAADDARYADITAALSGARADLEKITAYRNRFQNKLVNAPKLFGSLTAVLRLLP